MVGNDCANAEAEALMSEDVGSSQGVIPRRKSTLIE